MHPEKTYLPLMLVLVIGTVIATWLGKLQVYFAPNATPGAHGATPSTKLATTYIHTTTCPCATAIVTVSFSTSTSITQTKLDKTSSTPFS